MAGLSGKTAWVMLAKQSAKGTAATVALPGASTPGTYKSPFAGGNIMPVRETDVLSETDSSRDRGQAYVTTSGVEGSPEIYVRDASIGAYLFACLGADAVTGTTPNFVHAITPANTIPYHTLWRNISDTLWERYEDCYIGSLAISAEAGSPLRAVAGVQGRKAVRLTADPSASPAIPLDSNAVYNYNEAAVTLGGSSTALIRSFELTVDNNVSRQQTDDVVPYDVVVGQRDISLGFDLIFETLDEYNKFHYGGISGTAVSPTIFTTSASFTFSKGTNNEVTFTLPSIAYQEFPVEPSAAGDPITVSVRAVAQRTGSALLTATVKNQAAVY